jgi:predicted secreted protein
VVFVDLSIEEEINLLRLQAKLFLILLLLCAADVTRVLAAEAPNTLTITEADQGHAVEVGRGGMVTLRLGVEADAGFSWRITHKDAKLQLMGEPGVERIPPGKPDAPQTQIFRFRANGSSALDLAYSRGEGKKAAPVKKYSVKIQVPAEAG